MHYNPFVYIRSEKDVLKVVNTLIVNTKGEGEKSAEDFWVKAERLLYCALIGYIWYEAPAEEMNFTTLLELINASEAREDDEEYQSPVDLLFADLEERSPDHFAVKQYKKYKLAAGKTAKSILISCGARLARWYFLTSLDLGCYFRLWFWSGWSRLGTLCGQLPRFISCDGNVRLFWSHFQSSADSHGVGD